MIECKKGGLSYDFKDICVQVNPHKLTYFGDVEFHWNVSEGVAASKRVAYYSFIFLAALSSAGHDWGQTENPHFSDGKMNAIFVFDNFQNTFQDLKKINSVVENMKTSSHLLTTASN